MDAVGHLVDPGLELRQLGRQGGVHLYALAEIFRGRGGGRSVVTAAA